MKRGFAAIALGSALIVTGCSEPGSAEKAAPAAAEAAAADVAAPSAPAAALPPAQPAAPGAPAFAVLYPGAETTKPVTLAQGPQGPGGILEFTTDADPATVVAFYKQRAEAAGLKPITSMDQGEVKAYRAGDGVAGRGQLIEVVATSTDNTTNVLLTWTNGR